MNLLVQFIIAAAGSMASTHIMPSYRRKGGRDKTGLSRKYAGAKLARKAETSTTAVRHATSLLYNGPDGLPNSRSWAKAHRQAKAAAL